jgi:hypothetical protein
MAAASRVDKQQQLIDELEEQFGLKDERAGDRPDLAATLAVGLVDWAQPLLLPRRYKCLWGGRGSGKSYAIADVLLIEGLKRKIRVLCAREFQVSMEDSVHALLKVCSTSEHRLAVELINLS